MKSSSSRKSRGGGTRRPETGGANTTTRSSTSHVITRNRTNHNNNNMDNETQTLLLEMNMDNSKELDQISKNLSKLSQKGEESFDEQKVLEIVNASMKSCEKNIMESFELRMKRIESKFDQVLQHLQQQDQNNNNINDNNVSVSVSSSSSSSASSKCSNNNNNNNENDTEEEGENNNKASSHEHQNNSSSNAFITRRRTRSFSKSSECTNKSMSGSIATTSKIQSKRKQPPNEHHQQSKKKRKKNKSSLSTNSKSHTSNRKDEYEKQWDSRYKELLEFKRKNNHVDVNTNRGGQLGSWVRNQRYQYHKYQQNKSSTMTERRIRLLKEIDFKFLVITNNWDINFEKLKEYKKENGDCLVKKSHPLGFWVKEQRKQYNLLQLNKKSNMKKERLDALESIGFVWRVKH